MGAGLNNQAAPLDPTDQPYRWMMLAGIWLVYFSFGLVMTAMAPLLGVIRGDLGLSNTAMGSALGIWPLIYIGLAIPAGVFIDRFGVRAALLIAGIAVFASGMGRSLATGYLSLLLAIAVFGVGGPLLSVAAPKIISRWFASRDRGLAMGVYMSSLILGNIAALTLSNGVLMSLFSGSWRLTLATYSGFALVTAGAWLMITAHPVARAVARDDRSAAGPTGFAVYGQLIRLPVVQVILPLGICTFLFGHAWANWMPEFLIGTGLSRTDAGNWAALPVAVGIVATLTIPRLADHARRLKLLVALTLIAGLTTWVLWLQKPEVLLATLLIQGIPRSCLSPIAILALMEARDISTQQMGAAGALFFTAAEVGGVLGPLLFGVLLDTTGGFQAPLELLMATTVVMLLLILVLGKIEPGQPAP
jgi:cyanate permease